MLCSYVYGVTTDYHTHRDMEIIHFVAGRILIELAVIKNSEMPMLLSRELLLKHMKLQIGYNDDDSDGVHYRSDKLGIEGVFGEWKGVLTLPLADFGVGSPASASV